MTTIITRLYADDATAQSVVAALVRGGIDADSITVFHSADAATLKAARVDATAAAAYAAALIGGRALVLAEVGFNPIGAARKAIKIVGRTPSVDLGLAEEDTYVEESIDASYANSTLPGNPLVLTNSYVRLPHGHIFGSNPIIRSGPRTSAIRGGAYMVPMTRITTPKTKTSAIRGGMLISSLFGLGTLYHR